MEENHLLAATKSLEMNPVAAKIVKRPEEYQWSSALAHLSGKKDDQLVKVKPLLDLVPNWKDLLELSSVSEMDMIHRHERTDRPLGS